MESDGVNEFKLQTGKRLYLKEPQNHSVATLIDALWLTSLSKKDISREQLLNKINVV
jgi:hypothetical protein